MQLEYVLGIGPGEGQKNHLVGISIILLGEGIL